MPCAMDEIRAPSRSKCCSPALLLALWATRSFFPSLLGAGKSISNLPDWNTGELGTTSQFLGWGLLLAVLDPLKPICLSFIKRKNFFLTQHELLLRWHLHYPMGAQDAQGPLQIKQGHLQPAVQLGFDCLHRGRSPDHRSQRPAPRTAKSPTYFQRFG